MSLNVKKYRTRCTLGVSSAMALAVLAMPGAAHAQVGTELTPEEVQSLPVEYRSGPIVEDVTETVLDADGVETITRTRRIETTAPVATGYHQGAPIHGYTQTHGSNYGYAPVGYGHAGYAPGAAVFQREQWIEECERRTRDRDGDDKGGIIGGLLGAIAGGIAGNRIADGSRLGGTLLGAGLGGLGGVLIGSLIGGGRDEDGDYDCEAALDSYLSQYGYPGAVPIARVAARTIPAPTYAAPVQYGYAPAYQSYGYTYAPPQQIVYVPVQYEVQQRVIVRETVTEELVQVPGRARTIPEPQPTPAPAPPRYIKGN